MITSQGFGKICEFSDLTPQLQIKNDVDNIADDVKEVIPEKKVKTKKEPVVPTGKVTIEDLREVRDRGYSVDIPKPKQNNRVERIGFNKVVKDGDNNKIFFKRDK